MTARLAMDAMWHSVLRQIMDTGVERNDRTGVGTLAVFGAALAFDLRQGFPACTTKRLAFRQVRAELACFLRGFDALEDYHSMGCTIWDGNARAWGDGSRVGRVYGVQWRDWRSVHVTSNKGRFTRTTDQLARLVNGIRVDPHGRRHCVTAWNPGELDEMCLPPCHVWFQCFVDDGNLDLHFHMRSVDMFLGAPFDIASYALLTHLIAKETGLRPRRLLMSSGDTHIYKNHFDQVREVLARDPLPPPSLELKPVASLLGFHADDAALIGYESHAPVAAPLNV